ncbi:MAG TPA: DUF6049 family protein, partial [Acidimicrobiia bacterium]|nr:DUF6049 family protein [Acidimicrobiia bacterium]
MRNRTGGVAVAVLLLALTLAAVTPPIGAATGAAASTGAGAPAPKPHVLTLARQSAWAAPDGDLHLGLALVGAPEGLTVQVQVHRAVNSRTALAQTFDGRSLGGLEGRLEIPAPDLVAGESGARDLRIGVQGPASAGTDPDPARIVPGRSGVYPTEVTLFRAGTVVDHFVTPLVVIAAGLSPLTLAWVWRFDATPAHQPDGTVRKGAEQAAGPSGRLIRTARAAAAAGDVHLTLAPTPETLAAWDETAHQEDHLPGGPTSDGATAGLAALRTAVATPGHQVLASPFVPVDVPGLLDANLGGEIDAEFARGAERQQQVLGIAPTPGALLAPGLLDANSLVRLRQYGVERLVLPPEGLAPFQQRLTPGHPFAVRGKGPPYAGAVSDPDLGRLLEGDDSSALRAARFLAGLSLVALEAPGEARGVVVVTPDDWDPPAPLLDAVLAGLRSNPAVTPATLDEYFDTVTPEQRDGRPLERSLARRDSSTGGDGDTLRSLRRRLAAFAGVVEPNSSWLETADRSILVSRATPLEADDRAERKLSTPAAYLQSADRLVKSVTSKVRGPKGQRVTLTSRRASIPISLLNATGRPLQVR